MLPILQNQSVLTMSSREIAEITGKLHKNVTPIILQLQKDQLLTAEPKPLTFEHKGNKYTEYLLNKRDSILLVARLSPEFTAALVDRWQELESKNTLSLPDFSNPVEAARAWADAKEAEQKALAQIEASKPALLVYEALANRRMDCNTTTLAKQLGTTATKLNIFLKSTGIKFKHQDLPMANYADWFNVVTGVAKNGYETIQCLITPLGQIEIAKLWSEK